MAPALAVDPGVSNEVPSFGVKMRGQRVQRVQAVVPSSGDRRVCEAVEHVEQLKRSSVVRPSTTTRRLRLGCNRLPSCSQKIVTQTNEGSLAERLGEDIRNHFVVVDGVVFYGGGVGHYLF